jgi:putative ABC transport system substrate-binding protein
LTAAAESLGGPDGNQKAEVHDTHRRRGGVADRLAIRPVKMLRLTLAAMLVLLAAPAVGVSPQSKTIPRLCLLVFEQYTLGKRPGLDAFLQTLRDLGYVDGRSIIIDYLSAEERNERFPTIAAECLRLKAAVIATTTTPAALAAKNATRTIPIVMIAPGDPVGTGLVNSLAQPGGNITGTSQMIPELAAKRLQLLKEAVPGISRVLVRTYLTDPIAPLQVKAMKEAAQSLGVTLLVHDIQSADDLPAAFDAGVGEGADSLIVTAETIFLIHRAEVGQLAARHKLPAMYAAPTWVRDGGGLMAYSVAGFDVQRRAGAYVDRILKRAKPSDLPVEQPIKFELVINLEAVEALGLTIPPHLLAHPDEVIE